MRFVGTVLLATLFAGGHVDGAPDPRIIGGTQATTDTQFYYQASLRYKGSHTCGCSIIAPDFVLTAAHCMWGRINITVFTVSTGSRNRTAGTVHRVRSMCMHPLYDNDQAAVYQNDVGLVMLLDPIQFSPSARLIPLATGDHYGSSALASGWGLTQDGVLPQILMYLTVNVLTQAACKGQWSATTDTQICTLRGTGYGMCSGDSGGPLVVGGRLYGIVSAGPRPCGNGRADIFANVFRFRRYIRDAMRQMLLAPSGAPDTLTCPAVDCDRPPQGPAAAICLVPGQ